MAETSTANGQLAIRIVTPDRVLVDTTADAIELPARSGYLEALYGAAARPDTARTAADAVTAALLDGLDVPRAVATARDSGGEAARLLLRVLALT